MRAIQFHLNRLIYGLVALATMVLVCNSSMAQDELQSLPEKPDYMITSKEALWNRIPQSLEFVPQRQANYDLKHINTFIQQSNSRLTTARTTSLEFPGFFQTPGAASRTDSGFLPAPQPEQLARPGVSFHDRSSPENYFGIETPIRYGSDSVATQKTNLPARNASSPGSLETKSVSTGISRTNKSQVGTAQFQLASQPKAGDRFLEHWPQNDPFAFQVEPSVADFSPTPTDSWQPYDPGSEMFVYEGKSLNANRRPLVELGRPWYQLGQLKPSATWLGLHNPVSPQFVVYGDYRMTYANAKNRNRNHTSQIAFELNLNFDLRLTATERFTAFVAPLDRRGSNLRWLLDDDEWVDPVDFHVDFGMFEGDLGALLGGFSGQTLPFDLPFAIGVMPMVVQNGIWMEDEITGIAASIPARNSPRLGISNIDVTFFAAYDEIDSPAFEGQNSAAKMYGILSFIEAAGGYIEFDYAFLEDRDRIRDRSYHNIGLAFSRRYGRYVSNSIRVIANAGQSTDSWPNTADGVLLLIENSLITSRPNTFVPYFNFWAGFDRPQSAARNIAAGGILRNTGILFESDGLTLFPTLDASANDTWGGSLGMNILTAELDQQLVLEFSFLKTMGYDSTRIAAGDQAGLAARYQIPLSNSWILRSDVMYGFLENTADIHGARVEMRHKF